MSHNANHHQSLTVLGVTLLVLGALAIALPFFTSFAITYILGFSIFISGIAYSVNAFYNKRWSGFFGCLLIGMVSMIAGVLLVSKPIVGVYTITLLLAIFFIVQGLSKLILVAYLPKEVNRFWIIINALVTIVLGILIWKALPASPWILGFLVGLDLILAGFSMIFLTNR